MSAQLLGMLNAEQGTNLTDANVTGTYLNGAAGNLLISATGLTAAQFNSFQPGRYTSYDGPRTEIPPKIELGRCSLKPPVGGLDPYRSTLTMTTWGSHERINGTLKYQKLWLVYHNL